MSQKSPPNGPPNQMAHVPQESTAPTFAPTSMKSQLGKTTHSFYIDNKGRSEGPYSAEQLRSMLINGRLRALDLVFRDGDLEWKPLASFAELRTPERPKIEAQPEMSPEITPSIAWVVLRPAGGSYSQEGPFSTATVIDGLASGQFVYSQFAWRPGLDQWTRLGNLPEFDRRSRLRAESPPVPPPLPQLGELEISEAEQLVKRELDTHASVATGESHRVDRLAQEIPLTGKQPAGDWSPFDDDADEVEVVVGRDLAQVPWEHERAAKISEPVTQESVRPLHHENSEFKEANDTSASNHESADVTNGREAHFRPQIITGQVTAPIAQSAEPAPLRDPWEIWGKKAAGGALMGLALLFGQHLITRPTSTEMNSQTSELVRRNTTEPVDANAAQALGQGSDPAVAQVGANSNPPPGLTADPLSSPNLETTGGESRSVAAANAPSLSGTLRVRGQKLDQSDAAVLVEGVKALGATELNVKITAEVGQVLERYHVRQEKTWAVPAEEFNADLVRIGLKSFQLPQGEYKVRVSVGEQVAEQVIFLGERNAKFLSQMEDHLRAISFEAQSQKKALFYLARDLDSLARELGEKYGQLRGRSELWSQFMVKWQERMKQAETQLAGLSRKPIEQQVFPEPTGRLVLIQQSMKEMGVQYQQSIRQQRDVASDQLSSLISELARTKENIGSLTWRVGAETD
ncbi:MAG TPA: DUF4339 domain-containing protein [Pseudobdellovibrionaceae bacterium]|nr:DUF4339 domain-containing protein [Pseudobdellovibrionaceae bacterium]